jgi:membrane-associated phospholipid phosphatase
MTPLVETGATCVTGETGATRPVSNSRSSRFSRFFPLTSSLVPLACSSIALAIVFWGLFEFDLPIARYMRSVTVDYAWARDQILIPWMAMTSWAGDWIGDGTHLVLLSAALLAVGWGVGWARVTAAGWQTLLTHGLAGLLTNALKHFIGRPRPRLVHSGGWLWMPSMEAGLDSFPSGHTAASFAVATVLARRFPMGAVLFFGIAGFVGLSRVLRGSHFVTDVAGGILFGILAGSLCARPLREWRDALQEGILTAATGMVYVFALMWVVSRPAVGGWEASTMVGLGLLLVLLGGWFRVRWWMGREARAGTRAHEAALITVGLGLALMSRSWLVTAAVACVAAAFWLRWQDDPPSARAISRMQRLVQEGVKVVGVLLALFILWQGAGALPIQ